MEGAGAAPAPGTSRSPGSDLLGLDLAARGLPGVSVLPVLFGCQGKALLSRELQSSSFHQTGAKG